MMTRDNEIPAIFNPRRVRAPSVVVTNDSPNGSFIGGGFTNILHSSNPQISRSDSISQPDGVEGTLCVQGVNTGGTNTPVPTTEQNRKLRKCKDSCCSELAQKVCLTFNSHIKL